MDNTVFERNYEKPQEDMEYCTAVFEQAVEGGFFQRYCDMVDKVPKIINPQDKENYEYLVNRCRSICKTTLWQNFRCCGLRKMGFQDQPLSSYAGIYHRRRYAVASGYWGESLTM